MQRMSEVSMRTLERRLAALELQQRGPEGFEVWIGGEDGRDMLGPNGETMSQAEYAELYPDSIDIGGPVAMPEGSDHEAA